MAESKYEQIVSHALGLVKAGVRPNDAWLKALKKIYPPRMLKNQEKHSCPKWAFSILCHSGYVHGITSGCCPESEGMSSASYTLKAVSELTVNPSLAANKAELKRRVFGVKGKPGYRTPNGEVEVLLCIHFARS